MSSHTIPHYLQSLWQGGFFSRERSFNEIKNKLSSLGFNPNPPSLSHALVRAGFITIRGKKGYYRYIQKHTPEPIGISDDVLPSDLIRSLGKDFKNEIADLRLNYGRSGNCTAFLLRKILEKLIYLAFAKAGELQKLTDQNGELVGLKAMLTIASFNPISGKPYLLHRTANALKGIKFLGDTAAHNPLANVSMKTIQPEMAFIVTAFQELAGKL